MRLGSSSHFLFVYLKRSSNWLISLFIIILFFFFFCFLISFFFVFQKFHRYFTVTWLAAAEWLTVGVFETDQWGKKQPFLTEAVVTNGRRARSVFGKWCRQPIGCLGGEMTSGRDLMFVDQSACLFFFPSPDSIDLPSIPAGRRRTYWTGSNPDHTRPGRADVLFGGCRGNAVCNTK